MTERNECDQLNLEAASDAGGAYVEKIGKTDLAKLSEDEWMQFLECVVIAFNQRVKSYDLDDEIPF